MGALLALQRSVRSFEGLALAGTTGGLHKGSSTSAPGALPWVQIHDCPAGMHRGIGEFVVPHRATPSHQRQRPYLNNTCCATAAGGGAGGPGRRQRTPSGNKKQSCMSFAAHGLVLGCHFM